MKAKTEGLLWAISFIGIVGLVHFGFIDLLISNQNKLIYYNFVLIVITVFDTLMIASLVLCYLSFTKFKIVRRE